MTLLGAAAPGVCSAQTLAPVVVTGSRVETSSFDLPYSVESVHLSNGSGNGLRVNASEILGGVPGVVIQDRQNYAQDLQISVRGFGARAAFGVRGVKLLVDGIPATNPDGQGQAAIFNLDTAERIEVLRGPFATIYGNHAGGVIQLFTRDGSSRPRARLGVSGGSHGTLKTGVGAEGQRGNIGFILDASHFKTDGERRHSAARRDQGLAKLTLHPSADSTLTLIANGLRQPDAQDPQGITWDDYQDDPSGVAAAPLQYNTRKRMDHVQGGAVYEHRFGGNKLHMITYAGRRNVLQYQSIPKTVQLSNPRHAGGVIDFARDFHGLGARWSTRHETATGGLTLIAGFDYDRARDDRQGYENFAGTTLGVKGALRRDEIDTVTSLDPYLQATWRQGDWDWSVGLRHSQVRVEVDDHFVTDHNGNDSGARNYRNTTPAFGALWRVTPLFNIYASAGSGFETPTLGELAYSADSQGFNFALKPSTSRQFELGLKAYATESTRIETAVYEIHTDDEIVAGGASGGRTWYRNAGKTMRRGIELTIDTQLSRNLGARAALTWMHARYTTAFNTVPKGSRIPGVPAVTAWAELAWQPTTGVSAAIEATYRGKIEVNDLNDARPAPAYTRVNLKLSAEQHIGRWTFSQLLRVDNLLDRKHIGSVIVGNNAGRYYEPGPGRSVYGGLRASYGF